MFFINLACLILIFSDLFPVRDDFLRAVADGDRSCYLPQLTR